MLTNEPRHLRSDTRALVQGRAHSLWFCDAHDAGVYRWYELAFMVTPGMTYRFTVDPFPLAPTDEMAASALSPEASEQPRHDGADP